MVYPAAADVATEASTVLLNGVVVVVSFLISVFVDHILSVVCSVVV